MRPRISRGRSRSDNTSNNLSGGLVRVRDRFPERARALSFNRLRGIAALGPSLCRAFICRVFI
jgi:hypothetical protein